MTIKTIPLEDLKIGIFILLELAWYEHPFLKSQFLVSSQDELKKIRGLGLKSIKIDIDRCQSRPSDSAPPPDEELSAEDKPMVSLVPDELLTVIHDKSISPEKKANLVQEHSITMMKNLLNSPTASNIKAVKEGMLGIVDLILKDDKTTFYLINITDHDYYTYTHSVNVGFLAIALAKQLFRHSDDHDLHALGAGFFLHDLGKVKITLDIINKQGKLSDEEMKRHPSLGFFLL